MKTGSLTSPTSPKAPAVPVTATPLLAAVAVLTTAGLLALRRRNLALLHPSASALPVGRALKWAERRPSRLARR